MANASQMSPCCHDPDASRPRRSSSRKSATSALSRSPSHVGSPRPLCPKDGDAFSYNPAHLDKWYLPQQIWDSMPPALQSTVASVQHSGAAVLTGFERLDKHVEARDNEHTGAKVPEDELEVKLDDLPPPKFRSISNASSVFSSDYSSPRIVPSSASQSGCGSPAAVSLTSSQAMGPPTPISLGHPADPFEKVNRSRERSFSTPLEPSDAYFSLELSHLRTEALPRLRHLGHKVDTEWYEAKRTGQISTEDANAFENWWAEKKCAILSLSEKGKFLATAHGISANGMGWTAP